MLNSFQNTFFTLIYFKGVYLYRLSKTKLSFSFLQKNLQGMNLCIVRLEWPFCKF